MGGIKRMTIQDGFTSICVVILSHQNCRDVAPKLSFMLSNQKCHAAPKLYNSSLVTVTDLIVHTVLLTWQPCIT